MRRFELQVILTVILTGIAIAMTLTGDEGGRHFLGQLLVLGMFAAAFDLAYGVTGIFSFGHAAFFGGGAYIYGMLTLHANLSTGPAILVAIIGGGALACIFGLLAFRASGIYFGLATLAMGQFVQVVIENKLRVWSGGSDGLAGVPRPNIFGFDFNNTSDFVLLLCMIFLVVMVTLALVRASPYGQALVAVRDNEVRAAQLGYHVGFYRVSAFGISGCYSALAGALFAALTSFVGPDTARWNTSGDVLIMTVLGGAGTFLGPLLGVVVFEAAKEILSRFTDYWYAAIGILFVAVTLAVPQGLAGALQNLASRLANKFWKRRKAGDT